MFAYEALGALTGSGITATTMNHNISFVACHVHRLYIRCPTFPWTPVMQLLNKTIKIMLLHSEVLHCLENIYKKQILAQIFAVFLQGFNFLKLTFH